PGTVGGVVQLDPTYGYELVPAAGSGVITLGSHALIDVSGGTAGGLSGGTVNFRAPLLANGDVNITVSPTASIKGSRATTLEAFATWSTDDPQTWGAGKHFDGLVDPAGWYNADGTMAAGTWTDQSGNTLAAPTAAQLADYLTNDYFTPTSANADHQTFYGYTNGDANQGAGTLMGFIRNLPVDPAVKARFANVQNFAVIPGIELANPDPAINGGNITVLTAWNLGAGTSSTDLAYRYNGQAPTVTFKAENDFQARASLSDGFFQIDNPVSQGATIAVPSRDQYGSLGTATTLWTDSVGAYASYHYGLNYFASHLSAPVDLTSGDPQQIGQYYALWAAYAQFLRTPVSNAISQKFFFFGSGQPDWADILIGKLGASGTSAAAPTPPSAAVQASDPSQYLIYLSDYANYVTAAINKYGNAASVAAPAAPVAEPVALIAVPTIEIPAVADNSPSPVRNAGNPAPLEAAALAGGTSASYRIVAGANLASVNPTALRANAGVEGRVLLDGHFAWTDSYGNVISFPTLIRTGTGSIDMVAAADVVLADQVAPAAIYTAGAPAAGTATARGVSILHGNGFGAPDLLVTGAVNPDSAGNISIQAGNDILGVENVTPTDTNGVATSQFWWQWMQTGNVETNGKVTQSSINFGAFDQGVMSLGGDVAISAGRDITNLAVSLPTTWYLANNNTLVQTIGGGDLSVAAGGDMLSGSYFVARGSGAITVGGQIASSGLVQTAYQRVYPVSTILAVQDGVWNVSARQGADIGATINPSYLQGRTLLYGYQLAVDSQGYTAGSAVNIAATTGDISFNSINRLDLIGAGTPQSTINDSSYVLPASVALTAFDGGITIPRAGQLYPAATGQLSLIASQNILLSSIFGASTYADQQFGLIDASPSTMPSPLQPVQSSYNTLITQFDGNLFSAALIDHSPTPLHAADTQPVRIYSLNGSVTDGVQETSGGSAGSYDRFLTLVVDKPAQIYAGQDIVNLDFLGQNLRQSDITSIVAGRDILALDQGANVFHPSMNSLNLGGPGVFDVEAGRDISLVNTSELTPVAAAAAALAGASSTPSGMIAVGNASNPYLPHESASIDVLFGVGKGVANVAFAAAYVDPAVATLDVQKALVAYMEAWDEGQVIDTGLVKDKPTVTLSVDRAWAQFQALPAAAQQRFNRQALFMVLAQVGADYNDPSSPFFHKYARGYQAINTLFPAAMGYTANSLNGGAQGALTPVTTGNLDIRSNTIQTQQGGTISILGPGGQALIGGNSAPPATGKSASTQGVLTLEQGAINIFTDTSVLLAQSRIFTEQGGAIMIWSSNGDINAGKGAKTTADVPRPIYVCDADFYCTRDARGEVSGAGIATLQTIPGAPSANVETVAPRGTVDFGAAGVRSSGNLIVAAQFVANAANVQVQGQTIGVPNHSIDVSANLGASTTAAAATQEAVQAMQQSRRNERPSLITVSIVGFGLGADDCDPNTKQACPR
ncbi:MAG TPA: filamentous hemagglutinin family protein, partial [Novosphingobium sp.]|nr:filamentous hemagglutinin family protein [Novosphingobium sp.]